MRYQTRLMSATGVNPCGFYYPAQLYDTSLEPPHHILDGVEICNIPLASVPLATAIPSGNHPAYGSAVCLTAATTPSWLVR